MPADRLTAEQLAELARHFEDLRGTLEKGVSSGIFRPADTLRLAMWAAERVGTVPPPPAAPAQGVRGTVPFRAARRRAA